MQYGPLQNPCESTHLQRRRQEDHVWFRDACLPGLAGRLDTWLSHQSRHCPTSSLIASTEVLYDLCVEICCGLWRCCCIPGSKLLHVLDHSCTAHDHSRITHDHSRSLKSFTHHSRSLTHHSCITHGSLMDHSRITHGSFTDHMTSSCV